jgi:YidC/Oxa1 family membrane protein insertase
MIGEIFNTLILKPVFNILLLIINFIPGHNFGLAIIIFTVLVSLLIWPSRKKQLNQTKVMQKLQPEINRIKSETKNDKQKQQMLLMELYKENGINPVGSLGGLLIQLPIFIAVINSVRHLTEDVSGSITKYGYSFIETGYIKELMEGTAKLNNKLLGIDLSLFGYHSSKFYLPLAVLAVLTAALQYIQIKQTMPNNKDSKKLKDVLGSSSKPNAEDMSAAMNKNMAILMPAIIGWICLISQGASSLYFFTSALVSILQQKFLLNKDVEEMEVMSKSPSKSAKKVEAKPVKTSKQKGGLKDKLTQKAVERAQNKAFKPVEGVKVRMVSSSDDKKSSSSLRGKK